MFAPPGVKMSADFPVPASVQVWVLGDPGEIKPADKPLPVSKRAEAPVRIYARSMSVGWLRSRLWRYAPFAHGTFCALGDCNSE